MSGKTPDVNLVAKLTPENWAAISQMIANGSMKHSFKTDDAGIVGLGHPYVLVMARIDDRILLKVTSQGVRAYVAHLESIVIEAAAQIEGLKESIHDFRFEVDTLT